MTPRPSYLNQRRAPSKGEEVVGRLIGWVLGLVLIVLCWNYGATDVIQALGGPDANVNVFVGALSLMFLTGVSQIVRGAWPRAE